MSASFDELFAEVTRSGPVSGTGSTFT